MGLKEFVTAQIMKAVDKEDFALLLSLVNDYHISLDEFDYGDRPVLMAVIKHHDMLGKLILAHNEHGLMLKRSFALLPQLASFDTADLFSLLFQQVSSAKLISLDEEILHILKQTLKNLWLKGHMEALLAVLNKFNHYPIINKCFANITDQWGSAKSAKVVAIDRVAQKAQVQFWNHTRRKWYPTCQNMWITLKKLSRHPIISDLDSSSCGGYRVGQWLQGQRNQFQIANIDYDNDDVKIKYWSESFDRFSSSRNVSWAGLASCNFVRMPRKYNANSFDIDKLEDECDVALRELLELNLKQITEQHIHFCQSQPTHPLARHILHCCLQIQDADAAQALINAGVNVSEEMTGIIIEMYLAKPNQTIQMLQAIILQHGISETMMLNLIKYKVDAMVRWSLDYISKTPASAKKAVLSPIYTYAAMNNDIDLVEILSLLEIPALNCPSIENKKPLQWALANGNKDLLLLLLQKIKINPTEKDDAHLTPLAWYCKTIDTPNWSLIDCFFTIQADDDMGYHHAFVLAAVYGRYDWISKHIIEFADDSISYNEHYRELIHLLFKQKQWHLCTLFFEKISRYSFCTKASGFDNDTFDNIFLELPSSQDLMLALLKKKILNVASIKKLYHYAQIHHLYYWQGLCIDNHPGICKSEEEKKLISFANPFGALSRAKDYGSHEYRLLGVINDKDIDTVPACEASRKTLLALAVNNNNLHLVLAMVAKGASVTRGFAQRISALHSAIDIDNPILAELLLSYVADESFLCEHIFTLQNYAHLKDATECARLINTFSSKQPLSALAQWVKDFAMDKETVVIEKTSLKLSFNEMTKLGQIKLCPNRASILEQALTTRPVLFKTFYTLLSNATIEEQEDFLEKNTFIKEKLLTTLIKEGLEGYPLSFQLMAIHAELQQRLEKGEINKAEGTNVLMCHMEIIQPQIESLPVAEQLAIAYWLKKKCKFYHNTKALDNVSHELSEQLLRDNIEHIRFAHQNSQGNEFLTNLSRYCELYNLNPLATWCLHKSLYKSDDDISKSIKSGGSLFSKGPREVTYLESLKSLKEKAYAYLDWMYLDRRFISSFEPTLSYIKPSAPSLPDYTYPTLGDIT